MADYWLDLQILYMHLTQPTGSAGLFVEVNIWIWKHLWDWGLQSKLNIFQRSPNQFSSVGLGINVPCKKKPRPAAIKRSYCTIGISFCWSARCIFCLRVFCLKGGWSVSNDARHDNWRFTAMSDSASTLQPKTVHKAMLKSSSTAYTSIICCQIE